jgi:hypothetical protein
MTTLHWRDKPLNLAIHHTDDSTWLPLDALVETINGHLQPLPGDGLGLCTADDLCLPLRADDLRDVEGTRWVSLAALSPLGIVDAAAVETGLLLGDAMPDLTLTQLDGTPFALYQLPPKPTLLFAWASW